MPIIARLTEENIVYGKAGGEQLTMDYYRAAGPGPHPVARSWSSTSTGTHGTVAHREARVIEGVSMGGFGGPHLGFKYLEVFGLMGIMAGTLVDREQCAVVVTIPTYLEQST